MYREYRNLPADAQSEFMERERRIVQLFEEIVAEGVEAGEFGASDTKMAALDMLMMGHTWALKGWMLRDRSLDDFIRDQSELALMVVGSH
jgi:hypothetical protein